MPWRARLSLYDATSAAKAKNPVGSGSGARTKLDAEAPPKRTEYLTVSAVVMLVLTFGVLFLIVITSRELGERPLVCAYGNGSHDPLVFPADGLCDAVFFDSLYKYPGYVLSNVDNASLVQLGSFLKHAKKYKRTRFGMGVAAQYVKNAEAEFASNTAERHYLPYLWANKVYDLGVLDFIPDEKMNADEVNVLFNLLKEYKRLQRLIPQEGGLKAYMVLGIALFKNYEGIYEAFNNRMRDNVVDVLILRTHFSGRDESRKDCVIQGSTYWKGSLTQYHPSLNYTLMYMANNKNKFGRAKMLISMSLAGRWYKSLVGGKNKNAYMVGVRCQPYGSKEYLYELQKFTRENIHTVRIRLRTFSKCCGHAMQSTPNLPPKPHPTREDWEVALLGCYDLSSQKALVDRARVVAIANGL
ncbi:hypothetical protein HPB51_028036 [Rhipicephalus microplus]|uniref:Uncharacterized protein n=1 Tax=Rhipicephalus microplus TaxID=6941 RepID=A0A9J6CYE6_RHIMP|nr:hypothetical protein HPB51_028036 [Rhipicephalus microplus]